MKTLIEIIDETVEFYSNPENRSFIINDRGNIECLYKGPDGKTCAFGRILTKVGLGKVSYFENKTAGNLIRGVLDINDMKEEYKEHFDNIDFWDDLQALHDKSIHWNESYGLSEEGKVKVNFLKEMYKLK